LLGRPFYLYLYFDWFYIKYTHPGCRKGSYHKNLASNSDNIHYIQKPRRKVIPKPIVIQFMPFHTSVYSIQNVHNLTFATGNASKYCLENETRSIHHNHTTILLFLYVHHTLSFSVENLSFVISYLLLTAYDNTQKLYNVHNVCHSFLDWSLNSLNRLLYKKNFNCFCWIFLPTSKQTINLPITFAWKICTDIYIHYMCVRITF